MTVEIFRAVVVRLLQSQGHRVTDKNRKRLIAKYLDMPRTVPETPDEILLWKILNTSEDIA